MNRPRLLTLDLIRFLAVTLVLGCHLEILPKGWHSPLRPFFEGWSLIGATGVDLFFVLSGFLISTILFDEYRRSGKISLFRFYGRRALKIIPPFYLLIAVTCGVWHQQQGSVEQGPVLNELFFFQGYGAALWNHTWTLAVEVHFYLFFPLVLEALIKRNPGATNPFRAIPWLATAVCLAVPFIRMAAILAQPEHAKPLHAFNTHFRLDAPFYGVILGYLFHFDGETFRRWAHPIRHLLLFLGAELLLTTITFPNLATAFYRFTFRCSQFGLGAAILLAGALLCEPPKHRAFRSLGKLGAYSYSIYLWHMAMQRWPMILLQQGFSWPEKQAIYLASALVAGTLMAKLVEVPIAAWRRNRQVAHENVYPPGRGKPTRQDPRGPCSSY